WAELFSETIDKAEQGFVVGERLQKLLELELSPGLLQMSPGKEYFYPNGQALQAGSLKKNPEYAQTLRLIAEQGADVFYQGEIAEAIVTAVQNSPINPGLM